MLILILIRLEVIWEENNSTSTLSGMERELLIADWLQFTNWSAVFNGLRVYMYVYSIIGYVRVWFNYWCNCCESDCLHSLWRWWKDRRSHSQQTIAKNTDWVYRWLGIIMVSFLGSDSSVCLHYFFPQHFGATLRLFSELRVLFIIKLRRWIILFFFIFLSIGSFCILTHSLHDLILYLIFIQTESVFKLKWRIFKQIIFFCLFCWINKSLKICFVWISSFDCVLILWRICVASCVEVVKWIERILFLDL